MDKFEQGIDPEGKMLPADRAKAAENARKAHYIDMALKSAKARRLRKDAS